MRRKATAGPGGAGQGGGEQVVAGQGGAGQGELRGDGHVAVIDIGKTNAKLALVGAADLTELAVTTRPNRVRPGPPWPHFDVEAIWAFLLEGLAAFQASHGVDAISVTTHGAAAALLAADGSLAAPILDYEHDGPESLADAYDALRPPFAETGSPRLGMGLNLGAQLFWQLRADPGLRGRLHRIVTYPQYWGFRLTGVAATDMTSLGCHTDLWSPGQGGFSGLVDALGLGGTLAPPRRPADVLGPVLPEIAARTGLAAETPVLCGIHDSNASLLPHLLGNAPPFSVVSTGTWVIAMSVGGGAVALDPARDTLINVDAFGQPVPSARFMGGREHDLVSDGLPCPEADGAELAALLAGRVMLLPAVEPGSGPFRHRRAAWAGPEGEVAAPAPGTAARGAALALYLALMTEACLLSTGHAGPVLVEGPFAANRLFLRMLAARLGCEVRPSGSATGTSQGAALLWTGPAQAAPARTDPSGPAPSGPPASGPPTSATDPLHAALRAYGADWWERLGTARP